MSEVESYMEELLDFDEVIKLLPTEMSPDRQLKDQIEKDLRVFAATHYHDRNKKSKSFWDLSQDQKLIDGLNLYGYDTRLLSTFMRGEKSISQVKHRLQRIRCKFGEKKF